MSDPTVDVAPSRDESNRSRQIGHVLVTDAFPIVTGILVYIYAPSLRPQSLDIIIAIAMWLVTGIGVTVGFHRFFTHRSFKTSRFIKYLLGIAGTMAAVGPVIAWTATHRKHHSASDMQGDPHSPNLVGRGVFPRIKGLFHAQIGWLQDHEFPSPLVYARDLLSDDATVSMNKHYFRVVIMGIAAPSLIAFAITMDATAALRAAIWAGLVRIAIVHQVISSVNSICHAFGARPHNTEDQSRNNPWLAIPTLGEAWHNNHHKYPYSAFIGLRWWQVDPGGWLIAAMEKASLVWEVKRARFSHEDEGSE